MKTFWTLLLLVALPLASWAQAGGPPSSIGTTQGEPPFTLVGPGQKHTNGDGVTIKNAPKSEGGKGHAVVNPAKGGASSETSVTTTKEFSGTISGLDENDEVELGPSNNATVSGTGGAVSVSGDSVVSVANTSPAGGPNTTVALPGGTSVTLSPGSTATFDT